MRNLAGVVVLACCLFVASGAGSAERVAVGGNVYFGASPVCALVLVNGQSQFTCDGSGRYDLLVPLDANGRVTVQAFADGFAPFSQQLSPQQARDYPVYMTRDTAGRELEVGWQLAESSSARRVRIDGSVEYNGNPVCALVLANGQQTFSCGDSLGRFSLDVPLDANRKVTLMAFASGFRSSRTEILADVIGETITYVRQHSTTNFLGWGVAGFYFPQFGAAQIVGPKRTDDNMQLYLPPWLEFNFNPVDLTTTFSADKPDCFDDCRGRGVYTRGGYPDWAEFTLPNGLTGRSGSVVDEQAEDNTNNTVNRIQMKAGVPASFCMHLVTDNTDLTHDSLRSITVRGGRDGQGSFDPNASIPNLSFDGTTDVHTFRFDNFQPEDYIKIRLNSGTPGVMPGFGGLMFDTECRNVPNAQCGNGRCELALGESCETCPGDCGACDVGATPAWEWYHHGATPRSHYAQGSNRLLVFVAHGVGDLNHRVEGVTYGGKAMHPLGGRSQERNDRASVSAWYLKENDIAAAVGADFTVDWYRKPGDRSFESIFFSDVSQVGSFGTIDESGCNDCFAQQCDAQTVEPGHLSFYVGTHERDGAAFTALNGYLQGADLGMGGNGKATFGYLEGVGAAEQAGARFGREGAFSLVCFEVQDQPLPGADDDGDGISDVADNCPFVSNPNQSNTDGADDGGDACDDDDDNDGWEDFYDNCPRIANPDQLDSDDNGRGDACEGLPPGC